MATDWGRVLAGGIKGVADFAGDSIRRQQEEDSKIRQAKLLEELRASTDERLAEFREKLINKRVDKDFSGHEADDMVYRDATGAETSRRALTDIEKEARENSRKKNDLDMRQGEQSIAASQAQVRQGDERNSLTRRGQDLDAAASRERNSIARLAKETDPTTTGDVSATAIGYQLTDLNTGAVEQAMKAGVPREEIQRMAQIIAAQNLARGDRSVDGMNNKFLRGLAELRKGIDGVGDNAVWSVSTFNRTREDEKKKK